MLSEKEILEKIEHYKALADKYKQEASKLEYGSTDRNLAWTAHRCNVVSAMVLEEVLNG